MNKNSFKKIEVLSDKVTEISFYLTYNISINYFIYLRKIGVLNGRYCT